MADKILTWVIEPMVVILFIVAILLLPVGLPLMQFGQTGAAYQIQFPNISSKQCQQATSNVRDISFLEVTSKIDPCTLQTVYYYCYRVTWKTDAKGWLVAHLEKDGIEPIKIETYEGSK